MRENLFLTDILYSVVSEVAGIGAEALIYLTIFCKIDLFTFVSFSPSVLSIALLFLALNLLYLLGKNLKGLI